MPRPSSWIERARLLWLVWLLAGSASASAADPGEIEARTALIDAAIRAQKLATLVVQEEGEAEGRPPELRFYSRRGKLVAVEIAVGHEVWRSMITVYFDDNGAPLKYSRVVTGREPAPEREAIFYRDSQALGANPPPRVNPAQLLSTFLALQAIRKSAAAY